MREAVLHKIFLKPQKSYDTLDSDRCLGILSEYGVVLRTFRILQTYWVQHADGGKIRWLMWPLFQGLTRGEPGITSVPNDLQRAHGCRHHALGDNSHSDRCRQRGNQQDGAGSGGVLLRGQQAHRVAPARELKSWFDVLTDLFRQFGLRMNMWKTVIMVCYPCHAPGVAHCVQQHIERSSS